MYVYSCIYSCVLKLLVFLSVVVGSCVVVNKELCSCFSHPSSVCISWEPRPLQSCGSSVSGMAGLEAAGGGGTAAPGVPVHRWDAADERDVPGHQRGSWAAGQWGPQQQRGPQPSMDSAMTDPCHDANKAGRKPAAALAAGGKGKGGTGHKPGWGCGREEEEGEHCREDAQTDAVWPGWKEGRHKQRRGSKVFLATQAGEVCVCCPGALHLACRTPPQVMGHKPSREPPPF